MILFVYVLIVCEITFINLLGANRCSTKRYSEPVIWTVFILFTAVALALMLGLVVRLPALASGSGLFIPIGALYLIPMHFMYKQPLKYTVIVMCFTWIYTELVFVVALRIGYMVPEKWFPFVVLVAQSLLFAVSLSWFQRFIKNKFLFIVRNLHPQNLNALLWLSLSWFLSCVLLNYVITGNPPEAVKLVATLLMVWTAVQSYRMFYSVVSARKDAERLHETIRADALTGLKNRISFYEDARLLLNKQIPFSILYTDLDRFKCINDQFGHAAGDKYLAKFAQAVRERFSGEGAFYRMSGDEFVFLYEGQQPEEFYKAFIRLELPNGTEAIQFLGYSTGMASFPADGNNIDALLAKADMAMYRAKRAQAEDPVQAGMHEE